CVIGWARVAGQGQEDFVERGRHQTDAGNLDATGSQPVQDVAYLVGTPIGGHADGSSRGVLVHGATLKVGPRGQRFKGTCVAVVGGEPDLQTLTFQAALEVRHSAIGDD